MRDATVPLAWAAASPAWVRNALSLEHKLRLLTEIALSRPYKSGITCYHTIIKRGKLKLI